MGGRKWPAWSASSCGPICNFLPRIFPSSGPRHRCGVPIKCCSPYKISPWRGHVLMNYRVRPRDRSNYIERLLTTPRERGPRKMQAMKTFLFLPSFFPPFPLIIPSFRRRAFPVFLVSSAFLCSLVEKI